MSSIPFLKYLNRCRTHFINLTIKTLHFNRKFFPNSHDKACNSEYNNAKSIMYTEIIQMISKPIVSFSKSYPSPIFFLNIR